ncbi:TIGR03087 family PEP-CTERM/XrtA system glycosyltransferase [Altericroceibacterium spongiae]|uniref:TIGR03087 family PEP-CTERM/XrtA system glycosyltransferase n=1 Tax=Altericroceibacterium spongiae TaxID=2320269 RepID=A0A420ERC6_9SPHN|nr:TIGR03087 family PEP-CTERM/XrtA system glycosyltransferase [Altericroceibacterium spongiae]RKF23244.1 TIGR03087 family PEP-CTERM/XrtA system glycosyltransferase [Altericroceibacterium spongiae]
MTGEVLFLAHRIPFPPDRGDKIRSHHLLKHLAQLAPVHVACFVDNSSDMAHEGDLATIARSYRLIDRKKSLPLAGLEALVKREAVSLAAFRSQSLKDYVAKLLSERPIETIYVFSGQMGQYVPEGFAGQVILDLVDVDSAKFEAYAPGMSQPMRWINEREGRLLKEEEQRLVERADEVLLVSDSEVELLRRRLLAPIAGSNKIRALSNGINSNFFNPALVAPEPELASSRGPHYVFTGQMDYPPNVTAALRVISRLLPAIREVMPEAQFHIVGRNPVPKLREYDGVKGCRVWGEVEDIRPFLLSADCVLVPLEIARGVQNKVLEAMAMGCAVVLSKQAATGIGATDQLHFLVADGDKPFVQAALQAVKEENRISLGEAARHFVVETKSWQAMLEPLADLVKAGLRRRQRL